MANRALLVGINAYPQQPLRGCINDVQDIAKLLVEARGFASSDIRSMMDRAATAAAIKQALEEWLIQGAEAGDRLFFHYSGHGSRLVDRAGEVRDVICPVDFDFTMERSLSDEDFRQIFAAVPVGAQFTRISDTCHSGDLARSFGTRDVLPRYLPPPPEIAAAIAVALSRRAVTRGQVRGQSALTKLPFLAEPQALSVQPASLGPAVVETEQARQRLAAMPEAMGVAANASQQAQPTTRRPRPTIRQRLARATRAFAGFIRAWVPPVAMAVRSGLAALVALAPVALGGWLWLAVTSDTKALRASPSPPRVAGLIPNPVGAPARAHDGPVIAIALSPAGDRAVTAGADGTVRVWDAATGALLRAWDASHGLKGPAQWVGFLEQSGGIVVARFSDGDAGDRLFEALLDPTAGPMPGLAVPYRVSSSVYPGRGFRRRGAEFIDRVRHRLRL